MPNDLSPRGAGRIIDDAFELYRANFAVIALSSAILLFPTALLVGVAQVFYTRGMFEVVPQILSGTRVENLSEVQVWSLLANALSPLYLAATYYIASCVLVAAPRMLAGDKLTVPAMLKGGWSRFGWLLLTSLLISLVTGLGSLFFLVPGIYLYARLNVARVVSVVEAVPVDGAVSRAWTLTHGMVWRTLGFAVGLGLLGITLQSAIDAPAVVRQIAASVSNPEALFQTVSPGWKTLEGALSAAAVSLVYPFSELAWFFYYLDLRARREGMDLTMAARELAARL
ncbi:MAG: hypothetical protein CVT60_01815 [Actinobacteria bacterium HGW-Actinobacteria-10]|nr:MAG: hypothetical protein CVT60_01815 [Actinobacteria bacterium HGW-Actinobacteria-10]